MVMYAMLMQNTTLNLAVKIALYEDSAGVTSKGTLHHVITYLKCLYLWATIHNFQRTYSQVLSTFKSLKNKIFAEKQ